MTLPTDRQYTSTHEWVKAEGDVLVVGISDPAQEQLGDLVFVGDVNVGATLSQGQTAGVVESVKAASYIYAPVDGEIVAFNDALGDNPNLINESPYDTWIFKIKPAQAGTPSGLLEAAGYQQVVDAG